MTFQRQAYATFKFRAFELEVKEAFNKRKVKYVRALQMETYSCLLGRIQNFKWWEFKFISELRKGYVKYEARNVFGVTNSSATAEVGGGGGHIR